ncbi:MAG: hypothetical protein WDA59_10855 [Methanofastidiosum sp.]
MKGFFRYEDLSEQAKETAYNRAAWNITENKPADRTEEEIMEILSKGWFDKNGHRFVGYGQ